MNNKTSPSRARELARVGSMMSLLASLAACGGGGGSAPPPPPPPPPVAPTAVLSAPSDGRFSWRVAQSASVALTDSAGHLVAASSVTCAAHDATQVRVSADCSQVTALRVGALAIDVSGAGAVATLSVQGVPQRDWMGVHGSARYNAMTVAPTGGVAAWGDNVYGVLDQGVDNSTVMSLGVATPALETAATPLADVMRSTVAERGGATLFADGSVQAWGQDSFHQLGFAVDTSQTLLPLSVVDLTSHAALAHVAQVELGDENGIALIDDGSVVSWGNYPGNGNTVGSTAALPVQTLAVGGAAPLTHVAAVSAGWNYSLALTDDGHVLAWGLNSGSGVLGSNTVNSGDVVVPGYVLHADGTPLDDIVQISAGYNFCLALAADGTVWGWGSNADGQLGRGTIGGASGAAIRVVAASGSGNLSRIAMVAAGGWHALALDLDGRVLAWGISSNGELGDGAGRPVFNYTGVPRVTVTETGDIAGFTDIVSVAAGYSDSYALGRDGRVLSWGNNFRGALGRVTVAANDHTPALVTTATGTLTLTPAAYPNLLRHAR